MREAAEADRRGQPLPEARAGGHLRSRLDLFAPDRLRPAPQQALHQCAGRGAGHLRASRQLRHRLRGRCQEHARPQLPGARRAQGRRGAAAAPRHQHRAGRRRLQGQLRSHRARAPHRRLRDGAPGGAVPPDRSASTELLLRCRDVYGHAAQGERQARLQLEQQRRFPDAGASTPTARCSRPRGRPSPAPSISSTAARAASRSGSRTAACPTWSPTGSRRPRRPTRACRHSSRSWPRRCASSGPLENAMPWFAQGIDAANGRLRLRRRWWLARRAQARSRLVGREVGAGDRGDRRHAQEAVEGDGGHRAGAAVLDASTSISSRRIRSAAATWARRAKNGVVDHKGEVFGYRNLFVIDGGMVPEAVGVNPSRSIAALAEHAVGLIVARGPLAASLAWGASGSVHEPTAV